MNKLFLSTLLFICFPCFSSGIISEGKFSVVANRSLTNPATEIDDNGIVILNTIANIPRSNNYYDTSGFVLRNGINIPPAPTKGSI